MKPQARLTCKALACVLAVGAAFAAQPAHAWGNDGHRAVGAMADKLIKGSRAEKRVRELLLPGETLASVANWADCVKGSYCGPQTPEMAAYVGANAKHTEYHYTDIPFQNTEYKDGAVGGFGHDIVKTLEQAIAVLQGKTDPASNPHKFTPRQALLLIAHMGGDIHQPLHVGAAFVGRDGMFMVPHTHAEIDGENIVDSRGGNSLLLSDEKIASTSAALIPGEEKALPAGMTRSKTKPFHSYWDSTVVDYAMRRVGAKTPEQYAQMMIDAKPDVVMNTGAPGGWPVQWANDALLVSKVAYMHVTPGARTAQKNRKGETFYTFGIDVPDNYPVPSSALARIQLTKGGYHLAALLRAIWP
ncbi:S1/P1 nuclease [Massilia glaciei]|uniref:Phospholipase n=1 Tax=Massilia glaciei TaxID=1524097 RepID=A0A2U2HBW4_9BURK|nr:S1/P1 nuclease [Massilia glaciei]PWF40339.1 phospholipase [Massilia glaciei]